MSIGDTSGVFIASPDSRFALLEGQWLGSGGKKTIRAVNPVSVFEGEAQTIAGLPDWLASHAGQYPQGGAIGFLSYELARIFERVPANPDPHLPDFSFAYYSQIECDGAGGWQMPFAPHAIRAEVLDAFDKPEFTRAVRRIQDYIAAGDIYQANLTQQFSARLRLSLPEMTYARLAAAQAPMRAFLKTPHGIIISNSPERFIHVRDGRILTSPIKGTLARRGNMNEDEELAGRLLSSAKDRAENVMIVDLLRNDLGRVCRYETIQARLCKLITLPHLFHLVSHIEGELRPDAGPVEILKALFPCGSITGAPKIRAMEILAELEPRPRGASMGAIGIIRGAPGSPRFEMDFNVAIRTMIVRNDIATFNVGCGIVYDSEPEAEWAEMLLKAHPLLDGLGLSVPEACRLPKPRTVVAREEIWTR